jgi:hypothetical protein
MKKYGQNFLAGLRDTAILFNEFKLPLLIFGFTIIGGGLAYEAVSIRVGEPAKKNTTEAVFIIWSATLLYSVEGFPDHFALQFFHFIMPLVGLFIFARGLADFGSLLFNRCARGKEWESAVASTMKKPYRIDRARASRVSHRATVAQNGKERGSHRAEPFGRDVPRSARHEHPRHSRRRHARLGAGCGES